MNSKTLRARLFTAGVLMMGVCHTYAAEDNAVMIIAEYGENPETQYINFNTSTLIYQDMNGAGQDGVMYKNLDLTYAVFSNGDYSFGSFAGKDMRYAGFNGDNTPVGIFLDGVDFTGANMSYGYFNAANMVNAKFINANLTHVQFYNNDDTNFEGADFTNANMDGVEFRYGTFSQQQMESTKSYKEGYIKLDFEYAATTYKFDFSGLRLNESKFLTSTLNGNGQSTNFTDAIINDVVFYATDLTQAQLQSTASWKNKDLNGISFQKTGVGTSYNLREQRMHYSTVIENDGAMDLTNADLRGGTFASNGTGIILKNTVMTDGSVARSYNTSTKTAVYGVELDSSDDLLLVYKFDPRSGNTAINAKISADSTASGGSHIRIEEGGRLDVIAGKTLTLQDTVMELSASNADKSLITVYGTINLGDLTQVLITVSDDFELSGYYEFINASAGNIMGAINEDNVTVQYADGRAYEKDWALQQTADGWGIMLVVPEPSTYAMIFGSLAFGLAAYRRKKQL